MFDGFAFGVAELNFLELFTHLSVWIGPENETLCSIYLARGKWLLIAARLRGTNTNHDCESYTQNQMSVILLSFTAAD
jgi:hypothetical protein